MRMSVLLRTWMMIWQGNKLNVMRKISVIKNVERYLFILFIIVSYALYIFYEKEGLSIYYILASIMIFVGFFEKSFSEIIRLSFEVLNDKRLYLQLTPVIIISNLLLFFIIKNYIGFEPENYNYNIILGFIFFKSIKAYGEEIIFRSFLLIKVIQKNNIIFWLLNILQSVIFSYIHTLFVEELEVKIIFGSYVFVLSICFAWMNRKFNSVLPSTIVHWMNGLQAIVFVYF